MPPQWFTPYFRNLVSYSWLRRRGDLQNGTPNDFHPDDAMTQSDFDNEMATREQNQTSSTEPDSSKPHDLKSLLLANPAIRDLAIFRRQYFQRCNVNAIIFPPPDLLRLYSIQRWIWAQVDEAQEHLFYPEYDKLFLKALLDRIEKAVEDAEEPDIVDEFAELHTALMNPGKSIKTKDDGYVWIKYVPPWRALDASRPEHGIDVLEKPNVLSASGSTAHRTWEAALCLGLWLDRVLVKGKRVLELGAGTGLLSLLAARQGAASVTATDIDEAALDRLRKAAARNNLDVDCRRHVWGDDTETLGGPFDIVLAADVVCSIAESAA